jgi:hypothetical protein
MKRKDALEYVSYAVDDALSERDPGEAPKNARLVGWQCGFEPLFVAVWSYLNVKLDDDEAENLAKDLLVEKQWFSDCENPPDADFII